MYAPSAALLPSLPEPMPLLEQGLREDIGRGDLTSACFISPEATLRAAMVAREPLRLCGLSLAIACFHRVDASLTCQAHARDGDDKPTGSVLLEVSGNARAVLQAERTALNLLSYLSGIATYTRHLVSLIADTGTRLLDTRKTVPGYRDLAKYAVRCGGGHNHRMRLDDGVMLKDNHRALAGNLREAIARARAQLPVLTRIEVECDTMAQVQEALPAGADMLLLDNMTPSQVAEAVAWVQGSVPLEASGGITEANIRRYSETGVDYLSLSALTLGTRIVDIGLDLSQDASASS